MTSKILPYFENTISKDLMTLVVGEKIGYGMARHVYEYLPDPSLVIKFEIGSKSFQNVIEWETWQRVQWVKKIHEWFAPCVKISDCGTILLQKKTHGKDRSKYPDRIPAYLTDTKFSNYGFIGNHLVCHDYGTNTMLENGMTQRMRKVSWFE